MTVATCKTAKPSIPLAVAGRVAQKLRAHLAPLCEQIEIAGSIRRQQSMVGDIELVAIPAMIAQRSLFGAPSALDGVSLLDRELMRMCRVGMLFREPPSGVDVATAWGPRYKKLWVPLNAQWGTIQLDLFLATPENWGAIFTIRTGSRVFSTALQAYIQRETPYRQNGGQLIYAPTGDAVVVPTERAYFATVGVPWVPPESRDVLAAGRLYRHRWVGRDAWVWGTDAEVRQAIRAGIYRRCGLEE